jgi:2-keto-3-deoxy-L-rhamnonate aldolase RhmA
VRPNGLKAKLRTGRRVVGALVTINSPELVEMFGHLGYDFVFLDAQHGGLGVETARGLIRAAELTGMTPLVRVRKNDPAEILEYLDAGAGGVIVPDVTGRADAEAAARATKYPTRGTRGAMAMSRAAYYGVPQGGAADYFRQADEETMCCAILENREVLGDLDAVVSVPDLDVVVIGPGDLALSMGISGGWRDPQVQEAVGRIHQAAHRAGKPTMIVALDHADGRRLAAEGYQALLVVTGSLIVDAGRTFLQALRG